MKFSDMMGKGDADTTEVTEPELPTEARSAPPAPEAPIRFGGSRSDADDAAVEQVDAEATSGSAVAPPLADPSISDVVAELAPRPSTALVTDQQIDTSAWLDGISSIDDDLLPH